MGDRQCFYAGLHPLTRPMIGSWIKHENSLPLVHITFQSWETSIFLAEWVGRGLTGGRSEESFPWFPRLTKWKEAFGSQAGNVHGVCYKSPLKNGYGFVACEWRTMLIKQGLPGPFFSMSQHEAVQQAVSRKRSAHLTYGLQTPKLREKLYSGAPWTSVTSKYGSKIFTPKQCHYWHHFHSICLV